VGDGTGNAWRSRLVLGEDPDGRVAESLDEGGAVGLFSRRRTRAAAIVSARNERREESEAVRRHLEDFVRTRVGVEAYVEPPTTVTPPTVLLVATSGEWTRRRVTDDALLRGLAEHLKIPVYDVQRVGYPQRMRDYNERRKRDAIRAREAEGL
jgi:hypothetical protein